MKKNLIYAGMLLLGMTVATGCSNEESLEQVLNNGNVIEAVIENPTKGRTSVSDNYEVLWTVGDAFSVFDNDTEQATLTLSEGAGTTSGKFTIGNDITITDEMVALFPASNALSYTFAESYTSQETDAPMSATFANGKFTFSLLTAMVRVVVEDVPAGEVSMTISSGNKEVLTGEATLSNGILSVPTQGETSVSVNFDTNEAKTLTFDVPVPVQNYTNGLSVVVKSGTTEVLNKITNGFDAEVGKLYLFGAAYVNVADAEAANEKLEEDGITAVKVQSVAAGDEIEIPAKSETSAQTEHIIDLSSATLPTDGSVSINVTEATDGDTESTVEKLTVVVPNNTTPGSLTIDAPGTTVTIQGTDGTIIETIESTTADHTLIIGDGVTIKNLTIKKGNVELYGKLEKFTSEVPTTIKLMEDVTLTSEEWEITEEMDVTLDLNGKTLTLNKQIKNSGTLTLKAGNIITTLDEAISSTGGSLRMTDCEVNGVETLVMVTGGKAEITRGSYANEESTINYYCIGILNEGTTAIINTDVNVNATGNYRGGVTVQNGATATISGGNYYGNSSFAQHGLHAVNGAKVTYGSDVNFDSFYVQAINKDGSLVDTPSIVNGANFGLTNFTGTQEEMDAKIAEILSVEVASEDELRTAVDAGNNVKLVGKVTLTSQLDITGQTIIHLNGNTLTLNKKIINSGTLTLKGQGNIITHLDEAITSTGSLTMTDCEVNGVQTLVMVIGGTASITGGSYANEDSENAYYCIGILNAGTTATINTDVNVDATGNYRGGVTVQAGATATISGGNYYGNSSFSQHGLHAVNGATVTYGSDVTFDRFYVQAINKDGSLVDTPSIVNGANFGLTNFTGTQEEMDAKIAEILASGE